MSGLSLNDYVSEKKEVVEQKQIKTNTDKKETENSAIAPKMITMTFTLPEQQINDFKFLLDNASELKEAVVYTKFARLSEAFYDAIRSANAKKLDAIIKDADFNFKAALKRGFLDKYNLQNLSIEHADRDVLKILIKTLSLNYSERLSRFVTQDYYYVDEDSDFFGVGVAAQLETLLKATKILDDLGVKLQHNIPYQNLFEKLNDQLLHTYFGIQDDSLYPYMGVKQVLGSVERKLSYLSAHKQDMEPDVVFQAINLAISQLLNGYKQNIRTANDARTVYSHEKKVGDILRLLCKYNLINLEHDYQRVHDIIQSPDVTLDAIEREKMVAILNEVRDCDGVMQLFSFTKHSLEQKQKAEEEHKEVQENQAIENREC